MYQGEHVTSCVKTSNWKKNYFINDTKNLYKQYTMPFSLPPELSLEFICGTVTSEACMLVKDAAVIAGAGLLLLKREK